MFTFILAHVHGPKRKWTPIAGDKLLATSPAFQQLSPATLPATVLAINQRSPAMSPAINQRSPAMLPAINQQSPATLPAINQQSPATSPAINQQSPATSPAINQRSPATCRYTSLPIYVTHRNTHGDAYRSARPVCLPLHFVLFILFDYCTPVSSLPPPILFWKVMGPR